MNISFAILTPTPIEWLAMTRVLSGVSEAEGQPLPTKYGRIGHHDVVCVQSGKGESNTAATLQYILNNWNPRWVLLVGIAGGFPDHHVKRGDVVVAKFVYSMEFGKLVKGRFVRRPDYDYSTDRTLLEHALILVDGDVNDWKTCVDTERPDGKSPEETKAHDGYVASGDKVVDDPDHKFFLSVRKTIPELHAVEMEATGAGASIKLQQSRSKVGFLMIRGISDEPGSEGQGRDGTAQRALWKRYASAIAASFVRSLLELVPMEATLAAQPEDAAEFVRDVTIPDGTIIQANETFTKIWEIRNIGKTHWRGRFLKRIGSPSGPALISSPEIVPIPDTAPGASVQIAVQMRAPAYPTSTTVLWKMVDAKGELYFPDRYRYGLLCTVHVVEKSSLFGKSD